MAPLPVGPGLTTNAYPGAPTGASVYVAGRGVGAGDPVTAVVAETVVVVAPAAVVVDRAAPFRGAEHPTNRRAQAAAVPTAFLVGEKNVESSTARPVISNHQASADRPQDLSIL
jgi:hypothetical protein